MKKYLSPLLLSLVFLIVQISVMSDYGINWDAPHRMLRGQAYAQLLLTGQKSFRQPSRLSPMLIRPDEYVTHYAFSAAEGNTPVKLPERPLPRFEYENMQKQAGFRTSFYQHEAWNGEHFLTSEQEGGHPPLVDLLAALSNRFFFEFLGILPDIESYQLMYVLIGAIGVFIVSAFALDITSSLAASFIAGLSLAFLPLFFAETHFNMKDPIQAVFFAGSVWTFWHWIKEGRLRWVGLFSLFLGAALGVKWNIVFLPIIVLPWLFLIRNNKALRAFTFKKILLLSLLSVMLALGLFVFIWPASWSNPPAFLLTILKFYLWIGVGQDHAQPQGFLIGGFNTYPLLLLLFQTPEIILILLVFSIWAIYRSRGYDELKSGYLVALWFLIPIVRYTLPGTRSYNGIRQIMEVLPAMAVLAGIGGDYILQKMQNAKSKNFNFKPQLLTFTFALLTFIILLIPIIRFHPNENVYFNSLVGGLKGAMQRGLVDWSLTYGNVYKQGVTWLNQHAEKDANVAVIDGRMFAASALWFRPDMSLSPYHFSGLDHQGEYIMAVFNPYDQPVFAPRFFKRFLEPIYTVSADSMPLLFLYKNDLSQAKKGFEKEVPDDRLGLRTVHLPTGNYLEVDLGKEVRVTRIVLSNVSSSCNPLNYVFVDEFIAFVSRDTKQNLSPADYLFAINEKKRLPDGRVEFSFPAELARLIRVYPKSELSCFIGATISSISFLSE